MRGISWAISFFWIWIIANDKSDWWIREITRVIRLALAVTNCEVKNTISKYPKHRIKSWTTIKTSRVHALIKTLQKNDRQLKFFPAQIFVLTKSCNKIGYWKVLLWHFSQRFFCLQFLDFLHFYDFLDFMSEQ